MLTLLRQTLVIFVLLTVITGIAYPLVTTGIAQLVFPHQANGSLIVQDGQVVGSELVGQSFDDPAYFWGRLSATGPTPYTAFNAETLTGSSGSNYGPLNPALIDAAQGRIEALKAADPGNAATDPRRSRHRLGQRAGSAHQRCGSPVSVETGFQGARDIRGSGTATGGAPHPGPPAGNSGRAASERARAESGFGWTPVMAGRSQAAKPNRVGALRRLARVPSRTKLRSRRRT